MPCCCHSWNSLRLYDSLGMNGPCNLADPAILALVRKPLAVFRCPSSAEPDPTQNTKIAVYMRGGTTSYNIAVSNYLPISGTNDARCFSSKATQNGVFFSNSSINFRDITDGTSNTFAYAEKTAVNPSPSINYTGGVWAAVDARAAAYSTYATDYPGADCGFYAFEALRAGSIHTASLYGGWGLINGPVSNGVGPSSLHPGGAHFLMADGAVRFVNENIDASSQTAPRSTYQKLGCRNDGEVVGEF